MHKVNQKYALHNPNPRLPGPDLGVVGGAGVVTDEDVPLVFEMDLWDSSLLGRDGLFGFGALKIWSQYKFYISYSMKETVEELKKMNCTHPISLKCI